MKTRKQKLIERTKKEFGYTTEGAEREVTRLLAILGDAPQLLANVDEWLDGQPLTDVFVGKYCVRTVLVIRGCPDKPAALAKRRDILNAIYALAVYAKDKRAGEALIFQIRR